MKTLEESVAAAMDTNDNAILPYLPYLLQDFWEIGAEPDTMIALIKKHLPGKENLRVLDLGCGKGPVSVKIAKNLGYQCHGIDAIPEFIDYAKAKADEYGVSTLCKFEVGDIRPMVKDLRGYDIIILGAIGQIFGNYFESFSAIAPCYATDGIVLVDDAYIEEESEFVHPMVLTKKDLLAQVDALGIELIDEDVTKGNVAIFDGYDQDYLNIERRCKELTDMHPDKAELFATYLKNQNDEYSNMKYNISCATMVFRRKGVE
jgi:SAM-dependent methyltransferase